MKEKLLKLILPFQYALTILPVVFAPLALYGGDYPAWGIFLFYLAFCLYGWALAVFLPRRVKGVWHVLLTLLLPLALTMLVWPWGNDPWWFRGIAGMVASVGAMVTDRRCCQDLDVAMTTGSVVTCISLYGVAYAVIYVGRFVMEKAIVVVTDALLPFGLVSFFGGLYLLNWIFTLKMANNRGGTRIPASLRTSNVVMISLLAAVTLFAAYFDTIRQAAGRLIQRVVTAIIAFLTTLGGEGSQQAQESGEAMGDEMMGPLGQEAATWPQWLQNVLKYFLIVLACAIVLAALYFIGRAVIRLCKRLLERLRRWMDAWQQEQKAEYEDEQEDNFSWDRVREEAKKSIRRMTKPFRRVRLDQLPSDEARVRQIYIWMLERLKKKDGYQSSETPLELGERHLPQTPDKDAFIDAYNRVRFGEYPADAAAVAAGKETLKKL